MKNIFVLVAASMFGAGPSIVTFDSAPLHQPPAGWKAQQNWEVRKDATAPSQPYVLAHKEGPAAPVAVLEGASLRDGEISVMLKPVGGKEARGGGLVWRYQNPENYYLVRADATAETISVYKVLGGVPSAVQPKFPLARNGLVKRDFPENRWNILKVTFRGPRIEVYVNHRRVLRAEDTAIAAAGQVGLWTRPDSLTYFDNFRVVTR